LLRHRAAVRIAIRHIASAHPIPDCTAPDRRGSCHR
jgi:hypothetical protein